MHQRMLSVIIARKENKANFAHRFSSFVFAGFQKGLFAESLP